ncbi:MAG: hypothetical protein WAW59_01175 [Patescibacteria group bacterium]
MHRSNTQPFFSIVLTEPILSSKHPSITRVSQSSRASMSASFSASLAYHFLRSDGRMP